MGYNQNVFKSVMGYPQPQEQKQKRFKKRQKGNFKLGYLSLFDQTNF